ncbi:DUF58 domain-containing protein [Reichenbachiella carrageenanivorans]|uniref:DUF58 domain-containing protein n=1 Tax=Reichenbachiella carrageenanivorans TaxID=2979869 RepID=A0ABY6CWB1_9BACT|nr:DUF58 domain-containing protein [Reichenbachiella carrageenanivorans]UXX77629.1 DUF58 domain-containing protein [Reichenbachiella carrageenanivorans]
MKLDIDINKLKEYANVELLAKQLVEGFITGLHKSPYHGFSVEFAEHRLYNYGESTRHIDWKVYAKTDRLYTKRYEEETNLRCYMVLDASSSMYYPKPEYGKIKFSILAGAAISFLLQKQRDAVGLFTFGEKIDFQSDAKSTSTHLHNLLKHYQRLFDQPAIQQKTNVAQVLHEVAEKIPKRSLVVIFSDMLQNETNQEEIFSALNHLKHNKHEVLLFHVNDKATELNFEFEDRPYRFEDLETGQVVKLTPTEIKKVYKQQMDEAFKNIFLKCSQLKIDFVDADIKGGFDKILSTYLTKRAKMR